MLSIPLKVDLEGRQQINVDPTICHWSFQKKWILMEKDYCSWWKMCFQFSHRQNRGFYFFDNKINLSQNTELQNRSLDQSPPLITGVPKLLHFLSVSNVFLFQTGLSKLVMLLWNTWSSVKRYILIKTKNCFLSETSIDVIEKAGQGLSVMDTLMFITCIFPCFQLLFTNC